MQGNECETDYKKVNDLLTQVFDKFHEAISEHIITENDNLKGTCEKIATELSRYLIMMNKEGFIETDKRMHYFIDMMSYIIGILKGTDEKTIKEWMYSDFDTSTQY